MVTWSLLPWQLLGPYNLDHLVLITLTPTWPLLPWQPLVPYYPDSQLVLITMTFNCSPLTWQPIGPYYHDRHLVHITLTANWSVLHWQPPNILYLDSYSIPTILNAIWPLPLLRQTSPFYHDSHLTSGPYYSNYLVHVIWTSTLSLIATLLFLTPWLLLFSFYCYYFHFILMNNKCLDIIRVRPVKMFCFVSHLHPRLFQGVKNNIHVNLAWLERGDFQLIPSI